VLFSELSQCWKLADFGIASDATSRTLHSTVLKRGTASYRAPEILSVASGQFNTKSDIFAFGCIIFEIVTIQRLFAEDWATQTYARSGDLGDRPPMLWAESLTSEDEPRIDQLERLLASMLEIDPSLRPNAELAYSRLQAIRQRLLPLEARAPGSYVQVSKTFLTFLTLALSLV
jgi:serine/threonine protein kinase